MSLFDAFRACLDQETGVVLVTIVAGPSGVGEKLLVRADATVDGMMASDELSDKATTDALRLLREERSSAQEYEVADGRYTVFHDVFPAPAQLVIVGASHAASALCAFAARAGYQVVVCDARAAFAIPEHFPKAAQVLKGWPQDVLPTLHLTENTYVVLLSHDPRFDHPTLEHVLPSPVRYIGAIGSSRTQAQRFERLRDEGYSDEQLSRVYGPVGLDIGGRTPEEVAIAILGEITSVRRGAKGGFLRDRKRQSVTPA
jgi:xanthine dehydrogenase accessory factor